MAYRDERMRTNFETGAQRSQPRGVREEVQFPLRPDTAADIDPRESGAIEDQTGEEAWGWSTWDPASQWGNNGS